jgi:hypothetical protein
VDAGWKANYISNKKEELKVGKRSPFFNSAL